MTDSQSYILGKNDFQDSKLPTLWKSGRIAYPFPEETPQQFSARIDHLIFAEKEKAWDLFDYPTFRVTVKFKEDRKKAVYIVEVIDGERIAIPESDPTD